MYQAQYGCNVVQANGRFVSSGEGLTVAQYPQYQSEVKYVSKVDDLSSGGVRTTPSNAYTVQGLASNQSCQPQMYRQSGPVTPPAGRVESRVMPGVVPQMTQLAASRVTSFQASGLQPSVLQPSLQPSAHPSSTPTEMILPSGSNVAPAQMAAYPPQGAGGIRIPPSAPAAAGDLASAAQQVRSAVVPPGSESMVVVCILGGTTFQSEANRLIVIDLARALATAGMRAVFMTGGMQGVQQTFAQEFGAANGVSQIFHLLPHGQQSGFGVGQDIHAGADMDERKKIFGLVGDVYITIEGGPGVAGEARDAVARGAIVVPLVRSGGASGGMFDFPAAAMNMPEFVNQDQWNLLLQEVQPAESANALAHIVRVCAANILLTGGVQRS